MFFSSTTLTCPGPASQGKRLGTDFFLATKDNLVDAPVGFRWLKDVRTLFAGIVAVVRKTPWIRRPGKLAAKRP